MKLLEWLSERYDINAVESFAQKKRVPIFYGTVWYYLGGVSLFLFIIQVVTGILLVLYYQPGADTAYESVKFIVGTVQFGWLIRDVHSWSANLFILFIFLHMFTVYFARAYRKPRELTWISGFILLVLSLLFGFSGYLLPWNELAYSATKVGTDIAGAIPVIGDFLLRLLRAGNDVSGATLTRFFGIHTAIVPLVFTVFLALHLILIQVQGMSVPPHMEDIPKDKLKTMKFFPEFVSKDFMLWLIILNIIALLAVFFPWEVGVKADPLAPAPAGIRPEWYFMFMFQTLKVIPAHVLFIEGELLGILIFVVGGLIWFLIPFLDRNPRRRMRTNFWTYFGILVVIYMIVLTIWGYLV
jgi:cytochrome b6